MLGLKLYGKSVQDGVPTPDSPVEIESAGDGGAITTLLRGNNLLSNDFSVRNLNYSVDSLTKTDYGVTFDVISTTGTIGGVWLDHVLDNCPNPFTVSLDITVSSLDFSSFRFGANTDYKNVMSSEFSPNQMKHITHTIASDSHGSLTFYFNKVSGNPSFSVNISNIMISAGTKDHPFEPYTGQTLTYPTPNGLLGIPVESGGNYTDEEGQQWICDEVDFGRGKYVQRVKKISNVTFNASGISSPVTESTLYQSSPLNLGVSEYPKALCDGMQYSRSILQNNITGFYVYDDTIRARFSSSKDNEANIAKLAVYTWLVQCSSIETDLSPEQLAAYAALTTYKPNTTVTTDSSPAAGIEVKYVADTGVDVLLAEKQDKLLGETTQLAGFDEDGNLIAREVLPDDIGAIAEPEEGETGQYLQKTDTGASWSDGPDLSDYAKS